MYFAAAICDVIMHANTVISGSLMLCSRIVVPFAIVSRISISAAPTAVVRRGAIKQAKLNLFILLLRYMRIVQ